MIPAPRYVRGKAVAFSAAHLFALRLSFTLPILLLAVMISALSVIYLANDIRTLNAEIQREHFERHRLHTEWEQLIIEQSALTRQDRVHHLAEKQLGMVTPNIKSVIDI